MYDFDEEDVVLLMENYSPHLAPDVLTLLSNSRVRIVTFAPHTTQIFQIVFKRREQYQLPFDDDSGGAHFIKRASHDFPSTMTDANIWG
jgi:hypothetical protein